MDGITHRSELSLHPTSKSSADIHSSRFPRPARFLSLLLLLTLTWLLAACGPSNSGTDTVSFAETTATTQRIALDYQSNNDLAAAQAGLTSLNVPNPNPVLVLVAENAISAEDFVNADALVRLALALGLKSASIDRYAQTRGLFQQQTQFIQPTAEPMAETQPTATSLPENPTPVSQSATATPESSTPAAATATPEPPTATPITEPQIRTQAAMNVRGGPGTNYPLIGALNAGESVRITGKNPGGDWWQITLENGVDGWVYGPLVEISGDTAAVALAEIPTPPPATATPVPAAPTNTPAPTPAGVDFRLVEKRLWTVEETGGSRSGTSVNCQGGVGLLRVIVWDVNGNPLNGVTVQGINRTRIGDPMALLVSGHKGPGIAEYDMNTTGDDVTIYRDADGREVTSDIAYNNTGVPEHIPFADLIRAGYCTDEAQCAERKIQDPFACYGHYSWTVTFQRTY